MRARARAPTRGDIEDRSYRATQSPGFGERRFPSNETIEDFLKLRHGPSNYGPLRLHLCERRVISILGQFSKARRRFDRKNKLDLSYARILRLRNWVEIIPIYFTLFRCRFDKGYTRDDTSVSAFISNKHVGVARRIRKLKYIRTRVPKAVTESKDASK